MFGFKKREKIVKKQEKEKEYLKKDLEQEELIDVAGGLEIVADPPKPLYEIEKK